MNGAPEKPITDARPFSSAATSRIASKVKETSPGSNARSAATSSAERIGRSMIGPTSGSMRSATPIGSSGSMMSAKSTAASTPKASTGMTVIWAQRSGVLAKVRIE